MRTHGPESRAQPAERRRNLVLTVVALVEDVPERWMSRAWRAWSAAGHVVETMHDLGYDVRLTRTPFCW